MNDLQEEIFATQLSTKIPFRSFGKNNSEFAFQTDINHWPFAVS